MRQSRWVTAAITGVTALLACGTLLAASAPAAIAGPAAPLAPVRPAPGTSLPGVVSQSPVKWTPNVFAGSPSCNPQFFGSGKQCSDSTVWSTAVVNGEVVVAGAFTQVCQPGPASAGHCKAGTLVTRDDIFAYQLGTGVIDPGFAPVLDQGPVYSVIAGPDGTVYAGGNFTTVNGVSEPGIAQLSVAPGAPSDGQVVPGFTAAITGTVNALALNGNALYAGGSFKSVKSFGGTKDHAIARLNATTGAVDPAFKFTLGGTVSGTLQVERMSLTPNGATLAIAGAFLAVNSQPTPRVALIETGGGLGGTAALDNWSAPTFADNCSHQHDYVRGIDFSPDGSYFVVADTGYLPGAGGISVCDAAARFETGATGTDVQPTWVNYAGGDSFYSVAVTSSAVYVGGHNRWINNECGNNRVCESNAVLVNGVAALDPSTGLALPWWHPQTLRGNGVASLVPFPAGSYPGSDGGLLLGTDVHSIGGTYHAENALFPLTSPAASAPGGAILSGMFSQGRIGGSSGSTAGVAAMCVDDAGDNSAPGTPVQLRTCSNDTEQNWTIEPDGTIQINGMCLDTANGGTSPGTAAVISPCTSGSTQTWTPGAGNSLVNQGAGLCLDDPGASTSNGVQLQISSCDGSAGQSWPLPASPAPPPPPPTGSVYPSELYKSEVPCMQNGSNAAVIGAKVQLSTCVGAPAEQWTMESDGTFRNDNLCLDTSGGGTNQGTPAILNTCDGSPTQVWTPGPNGSLVNQAASLCLDDPNFQTADGTQLQIWPCDGGTNQYWWLPEL
jgi:Ricin-type beta-trefoil lectin domain/Domain of unknown function (DUF5122) beta-propeller